MPDVFANDPRPSVPVGAALRALPLEAPPADQWPRIAAALAPRARRRRLSLLLAAAAVLLAALALPRLLAPPVPAPVGMAGVPASSVSPTGVAATTRDALLAGLPQLMQESARLEAMLAIAAGDGVASGASLLLREHMHQRIQYVDALLTDPDTDPAAQVPLWQERVVLLRRLAGIEGGEQLLAAHGTDSTLVVTF